MEREVKLLLVLSIISVTILIILFIIATIVTIKVRRKTREEIDKKRCDYHTACITSPTTNVPPVQRAFPAEYIEFKDKHGNIINPKDYLIFIAKGESLEFRDIMHDNYMIFVKETQSFDFPKVVVIRRQAVPYTQVQYKIRRGWKICTILEAKTLVEKIMQSKDFDLIRHLQPYDNDNLILEDFVNKRLKRYLELHPFCEDKANRYHEVLISTTYHMERSLDPEERGKIRFSIHPASLIVGEVVQSFPM